jgi:serine protease AprX
VPLSLLFLLALGSTPAKPPADRTDSVLVVLREQADLSGAARIADRLERRRFVYESLRAQADAAQAPLRRELERRGIRYRAHFLLDMLEVEADPTDAAWLARRADVARVAPNRPSLMRLVEPDPGAAAEAAPRSSQGVEPNLTLVGAPALWDLGYKGEGLVIGIADTGFEWEHPALKTHYRGWDGTTSTATHDYNWHDAVHDAPAGNSCGSDTVAPCDDLGHGTGTAGFSAGGDPDADETIGVAPGARLVGCRNMASGVGTPARYVECFEWFLAPTDSQGANPRPDLGPDVINNSWSCPPTEGCTDPDVFEATVEAMRAAGVGMAFSAGNLGASCSTLANAPAVGPGAFAIAATWLNDTIAAFSAFGPVTSDGSNRLKPDLSAPGVNLRTAAAGGMYIARFSGTSASAPHVAGAFALLWEAVPGLRGDVDATEKILERSAVPLTIDQRCGPLLGTNVPNFVFGWGRLDIAAAYALATARGAPGVAAEGDRRPRDVARE